MDGSIVDQFESDIIAVIDRYRDQGISRAEAVGTLVMRAIEVATEEAEAEGE